jgi:hypothetical protein
MKHKGNILFDLTEQQTICITTAIHTRMQKGAKLYNITETQNCHSFIVHQTLSSKRPMKYKEKINILESGNNGSAKSYFWKSTDFSEEQALFITCLTLPCLTYSSTLKIEAIYSFETFVDS